MSAKYAAWIRIVPSPTTLAESSAVFQHVKTWGKVKHFLQARRDADPVNQSGDAGATYLAAFDRSLPDELMSFDVPVYHNYRDPKDADPHNIRGFQNRKPFLQERTLRCTLEPVHASSEEVGQLLKSNPYHGHFHVASPATDETYKMLIAIGAPPGIAKSLNRVLNEQEVAAVLEQRQSAASERAPPRQKPIPMDSITRPWREAKAQRAISLQQQKSGPGPG